MKKRFFCLTIFCIILIAVFAFSACGQTNSNTNNTSLLNNDDQLRVTYATYSENGGKLSYKEWLSTIKGETISSGSDDKSGSSTKEIMLLGLMDYLCAESTYISQEKVKVRNYLQKKIFGESKIEIITESGKEDSFVITSILSNGERDDLILAANPTMSVTNLYTYKFTISDLINDVEESLFKAATLPLRELAGKWELKEDHQTLAEYVRALFPDDYRNFFVPNTNRGQFTATNVSLAGTYYIYYHDNNCGDLYGRLYVNGGVINNQSVVDAISTEPSGTMFRCPD